jgi:methylthioribose-1-phosphate isomerase
MGVKAVYNCLISLEIKVVTDNYFSVRWIDGKVTMLDQRLLPEKEVYRDFSECSEVAIAIREMVIRGAPAIGVAAGFGLALIAYHSRAARTVGLIQELNTGIEQLKTSRPTAVNLFWAIQRIQSIIAGTEGIKADQLRQNVINEAMKIADEDTQMDAKMAENGQKFIPEHANIIHHCNTGALATAGIGTALGVIRMAHEMGKHIHVFVDETRPRLQGARLTSWELKKLEIPHTVIVDGASGYIMKNNKIDACLVGCDRIAANGDVANKIGTYNLALVAEAHGVPFYSVGPTSTLDLTAATGEAIPIEERSSREITHIGNRQITPDDVEVLNPAFDVTPANYITGIITERGVAYPPYKESLAKLMNG